MSLNGIKFTQNRTDLYGAEYPDWNPTLTSNCAFGNAAFKFCNTAVAKNNLSFGII